MTVVSSKEFAINQTKFYNLALNERVVIKRGKNIFHLTCGNTDDDDDDALLELAKSRMNDEKVDLSEFIRYIKNDIRNELQSSKESI